MLPLQLGQKLRRIISASSGSSTSSASVSFSYASVTPPVWDTMCDMRSKEFGSLMLCSWVDMNLLEIAIFFGWILTRC